MNSLLLYIGFDQPFNKDLAISAIKDIGVYNEQDKEPLTSFSCSFDYGDDSTIIRLAETLDTISLSGSGKASIKAVLLIQKYYKTALRLTNLDYTFDIELSDILSIEQLNDIIAKSYSNT